MYVLLPSPLFPVCVECSQNANDFLSHSQMSATANTSPSILPAKVLLPLPRIMGPLTKQELRSNTAIHYSSSAGSGGCNGTDYIVYRKDCVLICVFPLAGEVVCKLL